MTSNLRVILEIGKKRKVVAGAIDSDWLTSYCVRST